jgi:hypothetical protein
LWGSAGLLHAWLVLLGSSLLRNGPLKEPSKKDVLLDIVLDAPDSDAVRNGGADPSDEADGEWRAP